MTRKTRSEARLF